MNEAQPTDEQLREIERDGEALAREHRPQQSSGGWLKKPISWRQGVCASVLFVACEATFSWYFDSNAGNEGTDALFCLALFGLGLWAIIWWARNTPRMVYRLMKVVKHKIAEMRTKSVALRAAHPLPWHQRPGLRRLAWIAVGVVAFWLAARVIVPAFSIPHPHLWGRWRDCKVAPGSYALMYEQRNCLLCGSREIRSTLSGR